MIETRNPLPPRRHRRRQNRVGLFLISLLLFNSGCVELTRPTATDDVYQTRNYIAESILQPPPIATPFTTPPPEDGFLSPTLSERVANHHFPRLANQLQACYPEDEVLALIRRLPWWDLAVVDIEIPRRLPGLFGPGQALQRANPNLITLAYFSAGDIIPTIKLPINAQFIRELSPTWFLQDAKGQKIRLFQLPDGTWTEALNMHSPLVDFLPDFLLKESVQFDQTDGIFLDWASTEISWLNHRRQPLQGKIDINRDGRVDPDEISDLLWTNGFTRMLTNARRIMPEKTLLVGNAGWNSGPAYLAELNGVMIEQFMEGAMVDQDKYSWAALMRTYALALQYGRRPNVSLIMANSEPADDFTALRFALASTLMFDGYFCFTNRHGAYQRACWYDEYSVDRHTGQAKVDQRCKGYLGSPRGDAYDARDPSVLLGDRLLAGQTGVEDRVWRRDFDHGLVLVNPSRRSLRINLGRTYHKIRGRTDPAVNDGEAISFIKLGGRSGIILLLPPA